MEVVRLSWQDVYRMVTEDTEQAGEAIEILEGWLRRGDGIAVYQNVELGRTEAGHRQYVSYGSPAAQLPLAPPPQRLPDIGGSINWRYWLEGTCRLGDFGLDVADFDPCPICGGDHDRISPDDCPANQPADVPPGLTDADMAELDPPDWGQG